jgi:hypothetical protein
MEDKFLQEFLKTGLFDIGDNDDRLNKLRLSINDLEKEFNNDFSKLPSYTLVALDPNISEIEPALIETEAIVVKYWETLRSKYPTMPVQILRGVILNALNNVGKGDPLAARVIYLTAINFYPYAKLNSEKKVVVSLVTDLGDIAEENAVEEWSLIEEEPSLQLRTLKITDFKFGSISIDSKQLNADLKVAINSEPTQGYHIGHGANSIWGEHFAKKSSEGVIKAISSALEQFSKSLSPASIETPINNFFSEFKKLLDTNLKASFASITAVERRSKLLWWKETLYSSSLKKSYRGLDKNLLPVIMGADLNKQLPEITPISVDFLLRDTLYLLNDKKDDSIKFKDYLVAISESSTKAILKSFLNELNEQAGRISVTDFIGLLVNDRITLADFQNRTGISEDEEITLTELSVAILHDLLTQRLISE